MDMAFLIATGILSRLVPHLPNMTAVGASALFAGRRLSAGTAVATVAIIMVVTDLIYGGHAAQWAVYASLVGSVLLGRSVRGKGFGYTAGASLLSSGLFFVLTNFAVWAAPVTSYPKNPAGLAQCYIAAIPFLRNSVAGDMLYTVLLYAGFAVADAALRRVAVSRCRTY